MLHGYARHVSPKKLYILLAVRCCHVFSAWLHPRGNVLKHCCLGHVDERRYALEHNVRCGEFNAAATLQLYHQSCLYAQVSDTPVVDRVFHDELV